MVWLVVGTTLECPLFQELEGRAIPRNPLKNLLKEIGVAKNESTVDLSLLEFCIREDLNKSRETYGCVASKSRLLLIIIPMI